MTRLQMLYIASAVVAILYGAIIGAMAKDSLNKKQELRSVESPKIVGNVKTF